MVQPKKVSGKVNIAPPLPQGEHKIKKQALGLPELFVANLYNRTAQELYNEWLDAEVIIGKKARGSTRRINFEDSGDPEHCRAQR